MFYEMWNNRLCLVPGIIISFIPIENAELKDSCVLCSAMNPTVMNHSNSCILLEIFTQWYLSPAVFPKFHVHWIICHSGLNLSVIDSFPTNLSPRCFLVFWVFLSTLVPWILQILQLFAFYLLMDFILLGLWFRPYEFCPPAVCWHQENHSYSKLSWKMRMNWSNEEIL